MSQRPQKSYPGGFIALVGPDGVGKTTLACHIIAEHKGPSLYVHFRPPVLGAIPSAPPRQPSPSPPKDLPSGGTVLSVVRLIYSVCGFLLAYHLRLRPLLRRGYLVVADRWVYGYLVQPHALRYSGPRRLARAAVAVLPSPDVVLSLWAPAEVVYGRKQDLRQSDIDRELEGWQRLPVPVLEVVDTRTEASTLAAKLHGRWCGCHPARSDSAPVSRRKH